MSSTTYELTTCPVCGDAESVEVANRDDILRERELLWQFHGRRLKEQVPPERLMDRVVFSQEPPLRLAKCCRCAHIFRNPRERGEALDAAYRDSAPDVAVLRALFATQRDSSGAQLERLTDAVGRKGRGLEVGSYAGGFLAAAQDAGWIFDGVDVSAAAAAFATEMGFKVTCGDIGSASTTQPYDAIAIWNTFEQLYDSRSAVRTARLLLRDGGTLVVRVPNGHFYERWRSRLGGPLSSVAERLLAHNNLLTFPYRQGFSARSLRWLLGQSGFTVSRVYGDTLVPVADEWTTMLGGLDERVVKRLERLIQHGWHAPWVEVYARRAAG